MKIRLAEIADRAGVSVSTVSRVLNEKPGVNESTRRSVLTAIDVLGYDRPTRLRPRSAGLVGLLVPELENPFFPRFAQHVESALSRRGYTPVLCSESLGGIHEDEYVAMLLENSVAGIVFVSGVHAVFDSDLTRYWRLRELGLPFVVVNGYRPGLPSVSTDDVAVTGLGVTHLANMGHTRIGLAVGQDRYTPVRRKVEGFVSAMSQLFPETPTAMVEEEYVEHTTFTIEGGALAAGRLIDRGVTGILAGSDVMALGVIRAARKRGLRVPDDLSVVGSDDSVLIEFIDPPLTTIRQPAAALAEAACASLLDQIEGGSLISEDTLFAPELVVRGSTARVPQPENPGGDQAPRQR